MSVSCHFRHYLGMIIRPKSRNVEASVYYATAMYLHGLFTLKFDVTQWKIFEATKHVTNFISRLANSAKPLYFCRNVIKCITISLHILFGCL